jgi:uncharacterized phage protein (TIGR02218 family)
MTYDVTESSIYSGEPVELYKAVRGTTKFLYTSAQQAITYNTETYQPISIERTEIEQNREINRSSITVTVPRDMDIADQFRLYPPADIVSMTVFRGHPSDGEFKAIWVGRILSVEWSGIRAELTCEPIFSSLRRSGLRRKYGAMCPHVLYGVACGVNQLSNQLTGPVTIIGSGTLDINGLSGFADDYFTGGFVRFYTETGLGDTRFITAHTGGQITIPIAFQELVVGDSVDVFPGCNRTMDDCETKFNNLDNYGGWPYIPGVNPFGGGSIA